MALVDVVRGGPAGPWLVTAGYHTPNGPLHLGHLAGPFLGGDALARHLAVLGHDVRSVTAVDSFEAYVVLTARREGRTPVEVGRHYFRDAVRTLEGFGLHQDAVIDLHDRYDEVERRSHDLVARLDRAGRVRHEVGKWPRSRKSGQFLLGPFSTGHCPVCGADAGGSACEACGLFFGPTDLRDIGPRWPEDGDVGWEPVTTAFLAASPEYGTAGAARRFPAPYHELFDRYVAFNGPEIRLTAPLGWGVPYRNAPVEPEVVHSSYGAVLPVAMSLIADAYAELTGIGNPFGRGSRVRRVATAGFDSVLTFGLLLAFQDDDVDWEPFTDYTVNHFLLLNGEKISTSRGHVIRAGDYLDAGLPVDPLRMYLAKIAPARRETDFRPDEFARYVADVLRDRLCASTRAALAHARPEELDAAAAGRIAEVLTAQEAGFRPPHTDLGAAQRPVETWLSSDLARTHPYWWLKTAAVLTWPFMPTWARGLWRGLGGDGPPTLVDFERPTTPRPDGYVPIEGVTTAQVAALLPN